MKKYRLLQIPPIRFGIVLGLINGVVGMIVAPLFLITLGIAFTAEQTGHAPGFFPAVPWFLAGGLAVFTPVINLLGGFLAGVLIAMVYNFAARWTGGIEIVLDEKH
ncbi:MAG: hypothetical protein PSW75_03330 [bacterium]|nr:hypothetical protein [bacterium]MDI1336465.1 hypothetical protein [Lacunisphaera sp.]